MLRKKAPPSGIKDLASNIDNPGLIIIKTPIKPIKIAIQVFKETYSLRIIEDKATTSTGVSEPILWTSANDKYLNDKIKHPDSAMDKTLLNNWILIFPEM